MPEKRPNSEPRQIILRQHAQDPVKRMEAHRDMGCLAAVKYLMALRLEIKQTVMTIENPDPDFAEFYRQGNDQKNHWSALTRLLKRTGFTKIDVQLAFSDLVGAAHTVVPGAPRTDGKKQLLGFLESAVEEVYGNSDATIR